MSNKIGIHEPFFAGNEKKYLIKCVNDGWVSTAGKYIDLFSKKISKKIKSNYVLPVLNGTIGLHLSLIVSGVKENEEVIVPTVTFVASINVIKYVNANPVFMDTDQFLNIDEEKVIQFLKENTVKKNRYTVNIKTKKIIRAIILVHTFGNAANFKKLYKLCKEKNIKIIEDAAESFGTKYKKNFFNGKFTGTVGDFGVFSFNGNKIITSGNGGAVVFKKKKDFVKANYLINQAKDDSLNFIHNNIGYNYKISNISAAVGLAQLEKINFFIKKKKLVRKMYKKYIRKEKGIEIFQLPKYAINNCWINLVKINEKLLKKKTKDIIVQLNKKNIQARPVWYLNHLQKSFRNYETYKIINSKKYIKNLICLPSSAFLSEGNVKKIINAIIKK